MRRSLTLWVPIVLLCACAAPGGATLQQAQSACASGASHTEIEDGGTVVRVLGSRTSQAGTHEGFLVRIAGSSIRIEDNTDITGYIPLQAGERITFRGQYECDDGVVHWTHHDPSMRHPAGYIHAGDRTYS